MAHVISDRVRDTSTTTGVGSFTVSGTAPLAYRTFSAVCATNDTFFYTIRHQSANEWETGVGTYSATNTVARTYVMESSNSNAAVSFSAGAKDVVLGRPGPEFPLSPMMPVAPFIASGAYVGVFAHYSANAALSANTLYAGRFAWNEYLTFTRIGINVTTGATGSVRLGIYKDNANQNGPGVLVLDAGTASVSTTGAKEITVSKALEPNVYWLVAVSDTTPTVTIASVLTGFTGLVTNGDGVGFSLSRSFTYGALPANESTSSYTASTTGCPVISLRVV